MPPAWDECFRLKNQISLPAFIAGKYTNHSLYSHC
jgi:hypothetical protein